MTDTRPGTFIAPKAPRRCTACAEALRHHRDRGLCYGPAGVGTPLSARRYAPWDLAGPLSETWQRREPSQAPGTAALAHSRPGFPTPPVLGSGRDRRATLAAHGARVEMCLDEDLHRDVPGGRSVASQPLVALRSFDETERLAMPALELIRDRGDRPGGGGIRSGMPGLEKRLSRYPQLYRRVGFAHHSRPLPGDELSFGLTRPWRTLGLPLDDADFTAPQAIASIARLPGGNFRLLHRLFVQIEPILKSNGLSVITDDVVEAARSTLVIGIP